MFCFFTESNRAIVKIPHQGTTLDYDNIIFKENERNNYIIVSVAGVELADDDNGQQSLLVTFLFTDQISMEHASCFFRSPAMLRAWLNDPKNKLAKKFYLGMELEEEVNLKQNENDKKEERPAKEMEWNGVNGN